MHIHVLFIKTKNQLSLVSITRLFLLTYSLTPKLLSVLYPCLAVCPADLRHGIVVEVCKAAISEVMNLKESTSILWKERLYYWILALVSIFTV